MTLARIRAAASKIGASVDYSKGDSVTHAVPHSIMVDAPKGQRWRASGCHFLGGGDWWGTQSDGAEVFAAILLDMDEGLEPCDEVGCETCAEAVQS